MSYRFGIESVFLKYGMNNKCHPIRFLLRVFPP